MSDQTPPEKPRRLYELADRRVVADNSMSSKDPITKFLDEEDEEMIRGIKRLKLKTIEKEYRDKLGPENGETERDTAKETTNIPASLVVTLSKMDDASRDKAIEVYERLRAIQSGELTPGLWSFAIGSTQAKPESSVSEIVTVADKMIGAVKAGQDMAATKGQSSQTDPLALAKFVRDELRAERENAGSPADPIEQTFSVMDRLDKYGLLKKAGEGQSAAPGDNMITLEIEKLRTERDIKLKELDLKYGTEAKKLEIDRARLDVLGEGLEKVVKAAGTAFAEGQEEAEETQAASSNIPTNLPRQPPAQPAQPKVAGRGWLANDVYEGNCPYCGSPIVVPDAGRARSVSCGSCGKPVQWTPPPTEEAPQQQ